VAYFGGEGVFLPFPRGLISARGVIKAIVEGKIDVGPLDGYAHELLRHFEPAFADQVRIVASTDPTSMPCIVGSPPLGASEVAQLRAA
jgi:ABC-type phosphate/phosphonate transport system substrate-binding protein